MVVYWSIKSAIDYAQYALGATDKFRGTGVFNSIQFSRETEEDSGDNSNSNSANSETKDNKSTSKQSTDNKK